MLAALSSRHGALALLLTLVGLYSVMSFVLTQRTREIGIGAAPRATCLSTIWLVLRDALVMIAGEQRSRCLASGRWALLFNRSYTTSSQQIR
jgi:hypothetical protein